MVLIWKLQVIETSKKINVGGTLIKGYPKVVDHSTNVWSNLRRTVKSYFGYPLKQKDLIIFSGKDQYHVKTNRYGNFHCEMSECDALELKFKIKEEDHPIEIIQEYPINFPKKDAPFIVISDIDETILVSNIKRPLIRLRTLLLRPPKKRKVVEETIRAFKMLPESYFEFFYVSRSETNLFPLISSFILKNEFPVGPIYLRAYTRWEKLLKYRGREKQFKRDRIEWILDNFPEKKVILFGDDSQKDPDVFNEIVAIYPDRVRAVFIRRTGIKKGVSLKVHSFYYYQHEEEIEGILNTIVNEAFIRG